jgi:hypothetical protein
MKNVLEKVAGSTDTTSCNFEGQDADHENYLVEPRLKEICRMLPPVLPANL